MVTKVRKLPSPWRSPMEKVLYVIAFMSDTGSNGQIVYIVEESSAGNVFDVNRTTGDVYPTLPVDYEERHSHWLLVQARDGSQTSSQGTNVNVTVSPPARSGLRY